jgi:PKD repeat protein
MKGIGWNLIWRYGVWMCLLGWTSLYTHAQSGDYPAYDGLQVTNGMMHFDDQETFDAIYNDLNRRVEAWNADPKTSSPEDGTNCPDDNPILQLFEEQYGFTSVRRTSMINECEQLSAGRDPMTIEDHHLVDDVLAAMVNQNYQIRIGQVLYYMPQEDLTYVIANADYNALQALERGTNPYLLDNVTVYESATGCTADFTVITNNNSNTVGFNYQGEANSQNANFFWEFGDGNTSQQVNPIHNYSSSGTYTVCLTVEIQEPDYCVNQQCKEVEVGLGSCQAFFIWNETGSEGGLCFVDNSQILGSVTSWEWNFGDGSDGSTESNPCHQFPCDKTYYVSLTITTSNGCTSTITLPVTVDSYACCAKGAKTDGTHYFAGNQRRIKYKQKHLHLPFIHRVVVKMKHYILKPNGKWKKEKADLKIETIGSVFVKDNKGCFCQIPVAVNGFKLAFNKKRLNYSIGIGKVFKAKIGQEWSAKYYVDNQFLLQKETPVLCD